MSEKKYNYPEDSDVEPHDDRFESEMTVIWLDPETGSAINPHTGQPIDKPRPYRPTDEDELR